MKQYIYMYMLMNTILLSVCWVIDWFKL